MKTTVDNRGETKINLNQSDRSYKDACLNPKYVRLYERKESGEAKTFHFKSRYGEIEQSYLKREIPYKINGETYYDITSAYGYGGPIVKEAVDLERLFKEYNAAFNEACRKDNIVSAFYRFHIIENDQTNRYFDGELVYVGPNIVKDLSHPVETNMHKSVRNSVRKARKNGLRAEFDTSATGLQSFEKIYTETMLRNEASDYYYFDSSFFEEFCQELDGNYVFSKAVLNGEVIAAFLTLYGSDHAFGFLGGTLTDYMAYGASTFLEYETMNWLKANGLKSYILGGGVEAEDNLFRFKKKFDKEGVYPYYVGKKIYDHAVYDQLVTIRKQAKELSPDDGYFPLYRR